MLRNVTIWEAFRRMASEFPDRPCIVTPQRAKSYLEVHDRAERLAGYLNAVGMGCHTPRERLKDWESGQDHLALYLGNDAPYIEAMLAALRGRVAPLNINYRYVSRELVQVLRDCGATGVVYEADLASTLAPALSELAPMKTLIQVGGKEALLPGAILFEDAVAVELPARSLPLPDDLCIVCTGGTTGFPKAVLWRQADLVGSMLGSDDHHPFTRHPAHSIDQLVEVARSSELRLLIAVPLMHLAGFGPALMLLTSGGTIVLSDPPRGMDAASIWHTVERESVHYLPVVGDAFCRPLLHELRNGKYDTTSLESFRVASASVAPEVKKELDKLLGPRTLMTEGFGASESGPVGQTIGTEFPSGVFAPRPTTRIVNAKLDGFIDVGEAEVGWLASIGPVPLGYLGDPEKTASTVKNIEGHRTAILGDRVRWLPDGLMEFLGRGANTINTGGEKVYAVEVERALLEHEAVSDALVVSRPSERWGQEVVALVVLEPARSLDQESVLEACSRRLARYKLPKDLIVVDKIRHTAAGKRDYRWAESVAVAGSAAR